MQMSKLEEENWIKREQWIKLKVKQTALKKELTTLNLNKGEDKTEKEERKKKEGNEDDDDEDEGDDGSVDVGDVDLEEGEEMKELNAN